MSDTDITNEDKADEETEDTKPTESKKAESKDERFMHAVKQRSAREVKKAVDAARRELFDTLGIDGPEDIEELRTQVEKSKGTESEIAKAQREIKRLTKELGEATSRTEELSSWRSKSLKQAKLAKFADRTVDLETLGLIVTPQLEVDDDDNVITTDGKSVEDLVAEVLKKKPHLASPDFKAGAGTTKKPAKAERKPEPEPTRATDNPPSGETPQLTRQQRAVQESARISAVADVFARQVVSDAAGGE